MDEVNLCFKCGRPSGFTGSFFVAFVVSFVFLAYLKAPLRFGLNSAWMSTCFSVRLSSSFASVSTLFAFHFFFLLYCT